MDRHNVLVDVVEEALLKYSSYARAMNGKITKDDHFKLKVPPDECRLLRQYPVIRNGDSLKNMYDYKVGKYQRLCEEVAIRHPEWEVKQVTVIVSSPGAVYRDTLKELASKLELSPAQTVRVGQRLSDAAIFGSKQIWSQCQKEIKEEGSTNSDLIILSLFSRPKLRRR
jgi:hypothetical protein